MIPNQPGNLWDDLARCQEFFESVHAELTNPKEKEMMGKILEGMKTSRAKAEKVVMPLVEEMRAKAEQKKAQAEELLVRIRKQREEGEAKMKAAAAPHEAKKPAVSTPDVPADYGRQMRQELLAQFGFPVATTKGIVDEGSVAARWTETSASDEERETAQESQAPTESPADSERKELDDWGGLFQD